ncbi:MAG: Hsp70 family protein [Pseudohongiellaceae bacterium]
MQASNYHPIDPGNRDSGHSVSATTERQEHSSHSAAISFGIGVDYGTSNSVAAIFDGTDIHLVQLESEAVVMPSATYVDRNYKIKTGQAAIDQYIEDNVGRTIELSAEVIGEVRTSTGQIGDHGLPEAASTRKVYGQSFVDGGQQGRLFRGIKRLLGSNESRWLMVFDRPFRLVALMTPLLARIKTSIDSRLADSSPPSESEGHACLGHPVNFEGSDTDGNSRALSLLSEAYGYAKFNRQSFYPEPVAAALSYLHAYPNSAQQTILAVDFGGGTLDLCILKCIGQEFDVVATHGIALGGDKIDQLLFRELLFPLLGKGEMWKRAGEDREIETLFPFEGYEEFLLNWTVSYMLNQNKFTTPLMQRIEIADAASQKFQRLYDLIKNNSSYLVFQSLKDLKAELSSQQLARLDIPELDIELSVTRAQFEQLVAGILEKFQSAITHLLTHANLRAVDIQLVIRTGGSSLIPAVKHILESQFPAKVVEHDPFTSVATGLAIAEFQGLGELQAEQRQLKQSQ